MCKLSFFVCVLGCFCFVIVSRVGRVKKEGYICSEYASREMLIRRGD